jgi:predicted 3-demethylubiquinone-9 3-methyltransferase (glyoxalase superfamily)
MAQPITTFLWFDSHALEAAEYYTSIFPNSRITTVTHYPPANGVGEPGSVMTVQFDLNGQTFTALNGGPQYTFTEAISLYVPCSDQAEIDYYWEKLTDGGEEGPCGWLKDRYGVSWQIAPSDIGEIFGDGDPEGARRAMEAMFKMRKFDIAALKDARAGVSA